MIKSLFAQCCNPKNADYTIKVENMETDLGKLENESKRSFTTPSNIIYLI